MEFVGPIIILGIIVYFIFPLVFPWGKKELMERYIHLKEECGNAVDIAEMAPDIQEFVRAIIACDVASGLLSEMFEKSVKMHERTQSILSIGYLGLIPLHLSGTYVLGSSAYKNANWLTREWKTNKRTIEEMEEIATSRLNGALLEAYFDLPAGEALIEELKAWRRSEHKKLNQEDRERFFRRALIIGGGAILLTGVVTKMASNSMKDFGNPTPKTRVEERDSAGNLIREYDE